MDVFSSSEKSNGCNLDARNQTHRSQLRNSTSLNDVAINAVRLPSQLLLLILSLVNAPCPWSAALG
eukprot:1158137-Pelagomonas_calceolata.AAC.6